MGAKNKYLMSIFDENVNILLIITLGGVLTNTTCSGKLNRSIPKIVEI